MLFRSDSLRIILALVAHFDLELQQMDMKTAFLNGKVEGEVYMKQLEGFPSSNSVQAQEIHIRFKTSIPPMVFKIP